MTVELGPPVVADGSMMNIAGRGTAFVRDLPGPSADAPTVLLLHGWCVSADLNWGSAYAELNRSFRVVALDQRGHGRGIQSGPFSLATCADDAAVLLDQLDIDTAVVVGYSMGGSIALELFRRHRHRVRGLVLGATALSFAESRRERLSFFVLRVLSYVAALLPRKLSARLLATVVRREVGSRFGVWVIDQISAGDLRGLLAAGGCLGRFDGADHARLIDVATAVIVTERDTVVPPHRQRTLASAIENAALFGVGGDHDVGLVNPGLLNPVLVEAILHASAD